MLTNLMYFIFDILYRVVIICCVLAISALLLFAVFSIGYFMAKISKVIIDKLEGCNK